MNRVWSWLQTPLFSDFPLCDLNPTESVLSNPAKNSSLYSQVENYQEIPVSQPSDRQVVTRSPVESPGDGTNESPVSPPSTSEEPAIDEAVTVLKLQELRQYVKHLEASIRSCQSERKELSDWLFEQMTYASMNPDEPNSCESDIKRKYEERYKALKQRAKALDDQLQATNYVVHALETRGIPKDVSPKTYVRELLKRRGKGPAPSVPTSQKIPTSVETSEPTSDQVRLKEQRPSNTLPAFPTTSGTTQTLSESRRQARTLPTECTYSQGQMPLRRPSDPYSPSPPIPSNEPDLKPVFSINSNVTVEERLPTTRQFYLTPGSTTAPTTSLVSHPTSPELFSISYGDEPMDFTRKPSHGSYTAAGARHHDTPGTSAGMFHTVRHGLEIFGRQFRRPRAASEENVLNARDLSDFAQSSKGSNRPRSKGGWMSSFPKRSKKTVSPNMNVLDPSLQTPLIEHSGLSEQTPLRSRKSHSGSVCSTSALPVSTANPFINTLSMPPNPIDRSMSAYGGSTPLKEDSLSHPVSPAVGSTPALLAPVTDSGDDALSKILELLSLNIPSSQNQQTGTGNRVSSGSSVSIPGPSGSNGHKSVPVGTAPLETHVSTAPTNLLNSTLLSSTYSHTPISTGNVALALTSFYRMWSAQLSNLAAQQLDGFQSLRNELSAMRRDYHQLHETTDKLTAELGTISRDAQTREEIHKQKLSDATTRIDKLDATAEESRQAMQRELVLLRNEFRDTWAKLEYQLTTKTRDLNDSITTISNRVTIIEKPSEQHAGSDVSRIRHKVLHTLTDMVVSFFALLTTLLQFLIRCLNLGAVVTENRALALCISLLPVIGFILVYISEPLIHGLSGGTVTNFSSIPTTGTPWRDNLITILSFFRRFAGGST